MKITTATTDPVLLDLPQETPLVEWSIEVLAALSRGLSRHIVRFVDLSERVIAVKEIGESVAHRECELLRDLLRLGAPCAHPTVVITGRSNVTGEELNSVLVTKYLFYSLSYRALFSQYMRPETVIRLIGAFAALLVRLHLLGFYWGDMFPSNTFFRHNAGAFAAYLVDAETGELYSEGLTDGKRPYDTDVAHTNITGEFTGLQAGALLGPTVDTTKVGDRIVNRYTELWDVLTAKESFPTDECWRLHRRVEKLNEMGHDVAEFAMNADSDGNHITIQPKVVSAGHYHRQVMRLTSLGAQERQGQRMLNDLEAYRAVAGRSEDSIEFVAHSWLTEVSELIIHSVPVKTRRKLESAGIFHEVLEHRWYMSEAQNRYVITQEAVEDYVVTVLSQHRDERVYLGVGDTQEMEAIVVDDDTDEPMSEDDAEFAACDEQTLADYAINPCGFTTGVRFKGEQGARRRPGGVSSLTPDDARLIDSLASIS